MAQGTARPRVTVAAAVLLSAPGILAAPSAAATCDRQNGIWARDTDDGRWIVYFADQLYPPGWNTFFELWRDGERLARARAELACSNGIVLCYIGLESLHPPDFEGDSPTEVNEIPYVEIRADDAAPGAPSDWLVFAHLTEKVAAAQKYDGTLTTTLRLYSETIEDNPFALLPPSAYRFLGCRRDPFAVEPYGSEDLYRTPATEAR